MIKKIKNYLFRRKALKILKNMKTASKEEMAESENVIMICMRLEDWRPEMNDHWELEGNKTVIREGLNCCECKRPIVMSNGLYEAYSNNKKDPKAVCMQCSLGLVAKENEVIVHRKLEK